MIATPTTAPTIERPGGASPHLVYDLATERAGPLKLAIVAAPGLDVRGGGRHRIAVSVDEGAPVILNLMADETPATWDRSVIENRRVATTTLPGVAAGRHRVTLWMVDPEVVIEGIEVLP